MGVMLTACSSDYLPSKEFLEEKLDIFGTQEVTCPNLRILRAGEIFVTTAANTANNEPAKLAEIETVRTSCRIAFPDQEDITSFTKFAILITEVDIYINFMGRTEASQNTPRSLPYFIALANRFGKITTKKVFETDPETMESPSETSRLVHEKVVVNIPIDDLSEAEGYELLVGFQLSEVQVEDFRRRDR